MLGFSKGFWIVCTPEPMCADFKVSRYPGSTLTLWYFRWNLASLKISWRKFHVRWNSPSRNESFRFLIRKLVRLNAPHPSLPLLIEMRDGGPREVCSSKNDNTREVDSSIPVHQKGSSGDPWVSRPLSCLLACPAIHRLLSHTKGSRPSLFLLFCY
jgi:hypothetical protein